jgi:hypothetical protein
MQEGRIPFAISIYASIVLRLEESTHIYVNGAHHNTVGTGHSVNGARDNTVGTGYLVNGANHNTVEARYSVLMHIHIYLYK